MSTKFSNSAEFLDMYKTLKDKFERMDAELEITVRDSAMGVEGYIVVWNTAISRGGELDGCGKGGTRIKEGLSLDDVKRLARSMAEKNAAAGLPLGGAKSGLNLDPNDPDYEKKYRRFAKLCEPYLYENGGIFGGFGYDIGGKPPYNALWACDELGNMRCFTGKPIDMGGTDYDKEGIAGLGVAVAAKTAIEHYQQNIIDISFAVQGIGAMGGAVVRYFSEYGGKLKYLSDYLYGGTWGFKDGASQELLDAITIHDRAAIERLLSQEGVKLSSDCDQVLYQDVDVLFPCALEDVLHQGNAANVRAKYIAEGANNPTSDEAHKILHEKHIVVIPDIIANPGGIIAAYVELTSNVSVEDNIKSQAKVREAKNYTIEKVSKNTKELLDLKENVSQPTYIIGDFLAYKRIFEGD